VPYLVNQAEEQTPAEINAAFAAYRRYLDALRGRLPSRAYEFAASSWHYDAGDHRCPHDAWVDSVAVVEPATGERRELRSLEIRVELLGAYHDGRIRLTYPGVVSYSLGQPFETKIPGGQGHGDWLVDEVSLVEHEGQSFVRHEVEFARRSAWVIEAADIIYEWIDGPRAQGP
jgi:hypothetical protein